MHNNRHELAALDLRNTCDAWACPRGWRRGVHLVVTTAFWAGLAAVIGVCAVTAATAQPTATQGDVVAFCKAHGTGDFPDRLFFGPGSTPAARRSELSKLFDGLFQWRCVDGRVWVCADSTDGDWCSKKDANRRPSSLLRRACREDPNPVELDFADEHFSAFDWRCDGDTPVIIKSYPIDHRGFFRSS